ncbi:uncharacterized protein YjgD (DUF1641 family) [Aneurinibacillus soli]|uniref:Uncharacterized protein n=1 Tax=Aneurinibacillus soli TaxID=1500254 RepID=A0A0U4WI07_9BACL|nr:DUF1641 domain-containing protein [Aneurinibacillus soli]PYE64315.1 uncharacterized protein YjgD (DUF1641 family) [Aneurinibacillus soli]BAU28264.1 hypothetical protein CB4_02438 [Aneurinibacillus soli]
MEVETKQQNAQAIPQWMEQLEKPEVQNALAMLVEKLPQISDAVAKAEQGIDLAASFASDTESLNYLADRASSLSKFALNKENLEALGTIMESLPRLAKMVGALDRLYTTLEPVLTDKDILVDVAGMIQVVTAPVTERVQEGVSMAKEGMSMVQEAKARAARNHDTLSIFGVMKMLKEPAVQDGLKFAQAMFAVMAERKVLK